MLGSVALPSVLQLDSDSDPCLSIELWRPNPDTQRVVKGFFTPSRCPRAALTQHAWQVCSSSMHVSPSTVNCNVLRSSRRCKSFEHRVRSSAGCRYTNVAIPRALSPLDAVKQSGRAAGAGR